MAQYLKKTTLRRHARKQSKTMGSILEENKTVEGLRLLTTMRTETGR